MADKVYPGGAGIAAVDAAGLDTNDFVFMGTSLAGAAQKTQYSELALAFGGSRRNLLINADGIINQRVYVSGTNTTAGNEYIFDRWRVVTLGQNLTFADSNGKRTMTCPAGGLEQVVEGTWLQSGTYVISWEGTATCTVGGTARTNGEAFAITGGSNVTVKFSSGTLANPQLEIGEVPTPFDWQPFDLELWRCLRYYEKSYEIDTAIQADASNGILLKVTKASNTTTLIGASVEFKVIKRATPTIITYRRDGSATNPTYWRLDAGTYYDTSISGANTKNFIVVLTGLSGLTAGNPYTIDGHWIADAEITT
jgi:hypothetical protein